jgi:hypothetical protein
MGPFLVVFMGISIVTVPEAVRMLHVSVQRLRLYCYLVGCGLCVLCALWGIAMLVLIPHGLGAVLLGRDLWRPAYGLVIPYTISIMGSCASNGLSAGLHALSAARRSLRAMLLTSALYLALGVIGAYFDGAFGAVCGAAVATWAGAAMYWAQLHTEIREVTSGLPVRPVEHSERQTPERATAQVGGIPQDVHPTVSDAV